GVEQLLLGVVDYVALPVHEEAIAALADADVFEVARNAGEADVQGDPCGLAPALKRGGHGDHPGIVALEDGLDVRGRHVGALALPGRAQVEGEVLEDVLPRLPAGGPAVEQL